LLTITPRTERSSLDGQREKGMSEPELPWTRREIIDAVIAAYKAKPVDADLREVLS